MYDELVKALREEAEWAEANEWETPIMLSDHLTQAADAIEELSRDLDSMNEANIALYGALPKWIPVTERLPKYGTTVLVYGSQGGIYTARYERARAEWDRDSWWKLNSKSHICNPTHWMPLPEPPKEET